MASAENKCLSVYLIEIMRPDSLHCGLETPCSRSSERGYAKNSHLVAVFFGRNRGLSCQAFRKEGMVELGLSPVSEKGFAAWKNNLKGKAIPGYKFNIEEIFQAFLKVDPIPCTDAFSYRILLWNFLETLGVPREYYKWVERVFTKTVELTDHPTEETGSSPNVEEGDHALRRSGQVLLGLATLSASARKLLSLLKSLYRTAK